MQPRDIKKIQEIIDSFEAGEVNPDKIEVLFNRIRDHLPKNSDLKELCHFGPHPNRDRGRTLEISLKKVDDSITYLKSNEKEPTGNEGVYNHKQIFNDLTTLLSKNQIKYNKSNLKRPFMYSLFKFLDEIELPTKHKDVDKITVSTFFSNIHEVSLIIEYNKNFGDKFKGVAGITVITSFFEYPLDL